MKRAKETKIRMFFVIYIINSYNYLNNFLLNIYHHHTKRTVVLKYFIFSSMSIISKF